MLILQLRKLSLKIEHTSRNCPTLGRDVILMDEKMEAQRGEVSSLDRSQSRRVTGYDSDTLGSSSAFSPDLASFLLCRASPHPCPSLSQIWVTGSRQTQEGNASPRETIAQAKDNRKKPS